MPMHHIRALLVALGLVIGLAAPAAAHPHVWVTMKSELVYAPDGSVTGVRHAWTFDEMFSTFAVQGLESKEKGAFTREELKPLAEVNVTSLKEFDYFTFAKVNGKKAAFVGPTDYYLEHNPKNSLLTLHFLLPFKQPVKAQNLDLEVYDGTYFVDFAFAEKDPVTLAGAPAGCKVTTGRPKELSVADGRRLGEAFFEQLDATSGFGSQFANKISVKCP